MNKGAQSPQHLGHSVLHEHERAAAESAHTRLPPKTNKSREEAVTEHRRLHSHLATSAGIEQVLLGWSKGMTRRPRGMNTHTTATGPLTLSMMLWWPVVSSQQATRGPEDTQRGHTYNKAHWGRAHESESLCGPPSLLSCETRSAALRPALPRRLL